MNVADDPEDQHRCARAAAAEYGSPEPFWRGERYEHSRIRVGYLSADFHDHATAHLIAGLFEHHDRERFECFGLAYGPLHEDPMRARLRAAFEHFEDFGMRSPRDIAARVRTLEIDVLVDLKGDTAESRLDVLAYRPAPVQVHYLGYPGTLGTSFVDYLIADRIVVPEEARRHFSEHIIWLPHSYQVNDDRRPVAPTRWRREDAGLPAAGAVLCALHQTYKIHPPVFAAWMRVLTRVPDASLWLLVTHPSGPQRLTAAAAAHGVDPTRLVFATQLPQAEHLARLQLADLYLDTWPVSAHTTASDALWVGVPVIAIEGRSFAARVSSSLVHAAGFPELVARSLPEYEELVLRYASKPEELSALRARLAASVRASPLFDTAAFTRALETAYRAIWERQRAGLAPAFIEVAPA